MKIVFRPRWLWLGGLIAAAVLFAPIQTIYWDGGFSDEEYQIRFIDPSGNPVPDVTLRVQTRAGGASYLYPVNEFLPDTAPTSDADGRMVFHHASLAIEYGGRESANLVGMRFGQSRAPQYDCVFLRAGREVHRLPFDEVRLRGASDRAPEVRRTWQPSDWCRREFIAHHERWEQRELELFDTNGDGQLDREEATARRYFRSTDFDAPPERLRAKSIVFRVRETTIALATP